ncbi:MAG: BON domain-containing protein [Pirellulaceae bacterium]|nr:BON domain-containing protein [Pirellulaceae bacterium]
MKTDQSIYSTILGESWAGHQFLAGTFSKRIRVMLVKLLATRIAAPASLHRSPQAHLQVKLMMSLKLIAKITCLALLMICWAAPVHAQIGAGTGGGDIGVGTGTTGGTAGGTTGATGGTTGAAAGTGGGAAINTVPDTSAFDSIDRGTSIGGATTTGFGLGAQAATGAGGRATGGGGFGGLGGLGGFANLFGGATGLGQSTKPLIRTRLRSAITVAPMPAQQVQFNANRRIVQLPPSRNMSNVNVSISGRTATINGTVANDRDRRMTELLMRLEPGITDIQNNTVIGPQ